MRTFVALTLLLGLTVLVPAPRAAQTSPGAGPVVVLETAKGVIEFETYPEEAPKTVARIVELVKKNFYNGQRFHRAETNFIIQVGDPKSRDMSLRDYWGRMGSGTPIGVAEITKKRRNAQGAVGMANSGSAKDADSQFYITLRNAPELDGKYTVFGKVIKGLDVAMKIQKADILKKAQELAGRAFGADHVFFVTNGTSTSNKMAVQALLAPGDIAIVDRNCHKSHHYGMVLAGAQPLYVEAFPMTEYSMYGAVPLRTIKQALLNLKAEGRLHRAKMVDLTNCTFDGHIYNTRRVMEECLAIKPDLIFLWDEAWFGFARFSPFLRPRTAMGAANDIETWMHEPSSVAEYEKQRAELGADPSDATLLSTRLIPNPREIKLRVYQTNSTHKSMSALRQGSMLLVKDVEFHSVEAQFHEAVFTHASTSPNQQLIASLDVARRQMELEGYGLVHNAIEVALAIRQAVAEHPLISKYFHVLGADKMIPTEYRQSGFTDYLDTKTNWVVARRSLQEDEFCLDPTRITLVCGTAGFDGTQFKAILANRYSIQVNKTSRNSVLLQSNINNTRSDIAHLIRVLVEISSEIDQRLVEGGPNVRQAFDARTKSLMTDVPDLPNFSHFHDVFRKDAGRQTNEGDIRGGFYTAYDAAGCEYIRLADPEIDRRLKDGPDLVSANFVIPYPPGFPIMVPGQVITRETIDFMRKLDVKEIHGYDASEGLKLVRADALAKLANSAPKRGSTSSHRK